MNKKLLLLCLLSGLPLINAHDSYIDTVAELGVRLSASEAKNKAYEAMLESNKVLLKKVCSNAAEWYINPFASAAWNTCVVTPTKMYTDNWFYTVPWTITAIAALYVGYHAKQWLSQWWNKPKNVNTNTQTNTNAPVVNILMPAMPQPRNQVGPQGNNNVVIQQLPDDQPVVQVAQLTNG